MASGANFNIDRACALSRTGGEYLATTTGYGRLNIVWVNLWLHRITSLQDLWAYWVGNPVNQQGQGYKVLRRQGNCDLSTGFSSSRSSEF